MGEPMVPSGGEYTPPEILANQILCILKWHSNLRRSLEIAHQIKTETKELLYGARKKDGLICKELPVVPVKNLKTERFVLKDLTSPVGHSLTLRIVQQYPFQQNEGTVLFELEEFTNEYITMENEMMKTYSEAYKGPQFDLKQAPVGTCAVVRCWPDDFNDMEEIKPSFKRVKIVRVLDTENQTYEVDFIDYGTSATLDSRSEVFPLDKFLSILPPRVCQIELEGLNFYKHHDLLRRFLRYDSDQYLLDGEGSITAEVQRSGEVLIWNKRFPKEKFPYGINGFILKSVWEAVNFAPKLPPKGSEKREGFVVYSNEDAYIWLQFSSPILHHFSNVLSVVTEEKLDKLKGSVKYPERDLIYLAPHLHSDGSHYRAEVISSKDYLATLENPEDEVEVHFIDYGDKASVKVKSLVKAEDAHVLLPLVPKLCVKVHLKNIRAFKPDKFTSSFQADMESPFGVFVVKEEDGDAPAEVIFKKYLDEDEENFWVLNVEAVKRDVAEAVDPCYNYVTAMESIKMERILNPMKVALPPYLGLGRVESGRLQIGTEIDVDIMYHRRMPKGWVFLRATGRFSVFKEMELKLGELKRKFLKRRMDARKVYAMERQPGMGVLVVSKQVDHVLARGILIRQCRHKGKMGLEGKSKEETKNENGLEANSESFPETFWRVYLLDYGIVEKVNSLNIFDSQIKYLETPAFGILARHQNFIKDEDAQEWWYSLPWHSHLPKNNNLTDEKMNCYAENRCEQRKVKIIKLSNGPWPYGETAVVMWKIHRVGVIARQQAVEEKPKFLKNQISENKTDGDHCKGTAVGTVKVGASVPVRNDSTQVFQSTLGTLGLNQ